MLKAGKFRSSAAPLLAVLCALAAPLAAQPPAQALPDPEAAAIELVDRVVAVVDEDPILASDIDRVIVLGLIEPAEDEDDRALRRRALDRLIDERLRFQEVDRFGFAELPLAEVEAGFEEIRARFDSEEDFRRRLEELGLDEDGLRNLVARQLMVLIFVEERLGARVFVDLESIQAYYDDVLVPEMRGGGEEPPELETVREQIRRLLKEQLLDAELERWTQELRLEADVEDYFDSDRQELPEGAVVVEEGSRGYSP